MVKKNLKTQMGGFFKELGEGLAAPINFAQKLVPSGGSNLAEKMKGSLDVLPDKLDVLEETLDKAQEKLNIEDLSETEYEGEVKKIYNEKRTIYSENSFWEALQDEPCWIDPSTDSFTISGLSKLWCKWYLSDGDAAIEGLLAQGIGNYTVDFERLGKIYKEKKTKEKKKDGEEAIETAFEKITGNLLKAAQLEGMTFEEVGESVVDDESVPIDVINMVKQLDLEMGPLLDMGIIEKSKISGTPIINNCNGYKFTFCLIIKCLLGPAGILILKILPHLIKFFVLIYNFFWKLFLGFGNSTYNRVNPTFLPWKDKAGNLRRNFKPNIGSTIFSYLGLVIPWGIVSYKRGQVWGNGEFGKFIFTLMMVSVGIITMGGLGILVLLTAFFFFCGKTLMMFTNNIDVKKK